MKKCLLAALGMCGCATLFADFSASDYIQDGLMTQFDAIDNVGTGTHDANAQQWVDLTGGTPFDIGEHGSWRNGTSLYCDGAGQAAANSAKYAVGNTYEYVFKREIRSANAFSVIFYGGQGGAYGPFAGWCAANSDGFVYSHYAGTKITAGQFAVASCTYKQDETTKKVTGGKSMLLNALPPGGGGGAGNVNVGAGTSMLGAKAKVWLSSCS